MAISDNNSRRIMSEINITPFTDVVLVLLIIFMVTTPLIMQAGIPVKLPKTQTVSDVSEAGLTITLTKDDKIYFNDVEINKNHLENSLKNRLLNDPNLLVIIKADTHTFHGNVVEILDMAKTLGVKRLAIATEAKSTERTRK
ncbi:MAG: biopolymer transporter ExbD [Elusimicrobia bacterium]|nr:biopolymer transporter ExbD [Elusimicrobiota bacterium]